MKQSMFSMKGQKGFTLLELLIVVTIIAILSVGAILAYEGLTEKAQSATAANNTLGADQAIRNYRAVTGNYPNQWDNLIAEDGAGLSFVADETYRVLAQVDLTAISGNLVEAFDDVGIEELQARNVGATTTVGVEPNLQHSEGAAPGDATEIEMEDGDFPAAWAVIPTANSGTLCGITGGATFTEIRANSIDDPTEDLDNLVETPVDAQNYMITVNDNIGEDECHLVVALGFGHDAAHSTVDSNVAIAAAPAYVSNDIKPADNYARYIALFDVARDTSGDNVIDAGEVYARAKLIGLIDPEGNVIDQNVAAANDDTVN